MRRIVLILSLLLALSAHASYFEVQVPMTDRQVQTQMFSHQPLATGHFRTTVNPLDDNGRAYSPGHAASGGGGQHRAKKVGHDDDEDDPYMPSQVVPVAEVPYVLFALLILAYFGIKIKSRRKKAS